MDFWKERVPEGCGSNGEGSISHGTVFQFGDGRQKVALGCTEVSSRGVTLEEVVEGFACEKKNLELDLVSV